ncbi:hypothetical protein [Amycolatopsis methanolica]|uniref:Uncharacterized protein n=1 Tax=Amycolatopsis methanolica 239 TaxID=1068978 RepID=A0A076MYD2_AMYME|nr:hypothetical protein [Amycolatopsis methanolica]AIJ25658.1 hypothetical protein AMETH_5566 [Amycolatopsis methanolica 239]
MAARARADRSPDLLDRHGYHGPHEGHLHSTSWREDPAPILARLADCRAVAEDDPRAPRNRAAAQTRIRHAAAEELKKAVSPFQRRSITLLTNLSARFLALREQGKAGYLLTFDVARAAARRIGADLVDRGLLDDAADVFHLTFDEVVSGDATDRRDLVRHRRAQYEDRLRYRLPQAWAGMPELIEIVGDAASDAPVGTTITGVAASGGGVEGRARVVRDPAATELDDGDILVCETTDPSWVSLFLVAGAPPRRRSPRIGSTGRSCACANARISAHTASSTGSPPARKSRHTTVDTANAHFAGYSERFTGHGRPSGRVRTAT